MQTRFDWPLFVMGLDDGCNQSSPFEMTATNR